ncbi:MAG: hypothetical protein AB1791_22505 [Chloroflexota bacterium]
MKAYEFPVQVTPEGEFAIPNEFRTILPRGEIVRLIILVQEPTDADEQKAWARLTAEQFLTGYSEADSVYDSLN